MTTEHDRQRDIAAEGQRAALMELAAHYSAGERQQTLYGAADTIDALTAALERCAEARMPGEARRIAREVLEAVRR